MSYFPFVQQQWQGLVLIGLAGFLLDHSLDVRDGGCGLWRYSAKSQNTANVSSSVEVKHFFS